ncbi:MAG: hypothetical protein FWF87_01310 [Synergistaceae bacterium]|nr:hypothetical protein [Synergistaceae bacterium]
MQKNKVKLDAILELSAGEAADGQEDIAPRRSGRPRAAGGAGKAKSSKGSKENEAYVLNASGFEASLMKDAVKLNCESAARGVNFGLSFSYLALFTLLYVALPSFILSVFLLLRAMSPQSAYRVSMLVLSGIIIYNRKKLSISDYIIFFIIILICHAHAYFGFDGSYDGFTYHQPAVRRIAYGLNPVYDGYMDLGRPSDHWSDQATYFPKALWYFSAAVTAALGDIQTGKAYNLLLIFAALFFVLDATKKERAVTRILWITACLNPIALLQIHNYLADGALSSLTTISLFYAYLFFNCKPISRFQHFFCIVSLSMLYCVKTSGFGYGGIIMSFIVMNRFVNKYRESSESPEAARFIPSCKAAFKLSLRLGVPVLLLVTVWGFAPYATNLLNGRNIFHHLMGSEKSGWVQTDAEKRAEAVYPNAGNRFTRLFYSIASHTAVDKQPAVIKSPIDLPLSDWKAFSESSHITAAGLGPLFCLFLLLSVPIPFIYRLRGNGWLLLTLLTLLFAQPYSWAMRFAPFLWILPLACLLSLPEKRGAYLLIPVSAAFINILGVSYFAIENASLYYYYLNKVCSSFAGETVMLPQSIFEYHGIFDRYGIKQKYVNPEETSFYVENVNFGSLPGTRSQNSVNIFLKSELPPLPEKTLVLADKEAHHWLRMAEGLRPFETVDMNYKRVTEWLAYADKAKFYMSMNKEPKNDWELTLKGAMYDTTGRYDRELKILVFINNREIGTWQIDKNTFAAQTARFTIPQELMEESYRDETSLVTLMLRLLRDDRTYGLQIEEMRIRSK